MHCNQLRDPNTGELLAIVCGDRNRVPLCACGKSSRFQCDWKIAPGKTCDKHLCGDHAQEVGPEKHLCPGHQKAYRQWQERKTAAAGA